MPTEHGRRRSGSHRGGRERRRERARTANGQFAETVDPVDVLTVFDAVEGPVVTTTDVADVVGLTTEGARSKLNRLVDGGKLRRRKTGRTVVYWKAQERTEETT
jgi:hypothetical protein